MFAPRRARARSGTRAGIACRSAAAPARVSAAGPAQRWRSRGGRVDSRSRAAGRARAPRRRRATRRVRGREVARARRARAGGPPSSTSARTPGASRRDGRRARARVRNSSASSSETWSPASSSSECASRRSGRDVELDEVDAGGDRGLERRERVLGRDRRRAAMADHERPAAASARFTCADARRSRSRPAGRRRAKLAARGERPRRRSPAPAAVAFADEHRVEPLDPEELAADAATRSRRRCRARPSRPAAAAAPTCSYCLRRVDPEREAAARERR